LGQGLRRICRDPEALSGRGREQPHAEGGVSGSEYSLADIYIRMGAAGWTFYSL